MYDYGQECDAPEERKKWLREAAEEGHIQAMYELALKCDDPHERNRWLQEAADYGWEAAREVLGRID
jgi:hypothetical protein